VLEPEQILNSRILIIDDEPMNVMVLEETLNQGGYNSIKSITDPRQALQEFQTYKPDVILLDLNMPHLDGYQVMEQIKKEDPDQLTPIMVLTAQADQSSLINSMDAGARDFLTKPFDVVEVSLRIKNLLEVSLLYNQSYLFNDIWEEKFNTNTFELAALRLKLQHEMSQRQKLEEKLSALTSSAENNG
jgi:putative two-component system response regulator